MKTKTEATIGKTENNMARPWIWNDLGALQQRNLWGGINTDIRRATLSQQLLMSNANLLNIIIFVSYM